MRIHTYEENGSEYATVLSRKPITLWLWPFHVDTYVQVVGQWRHLETGEAARGAVWNDNLHRKLNDMVEARKLREKRKAAKKAAAKKALEEAKPGDVVPIEGLKDFPTKADYYALQRCLERANCDVKEAQVARDETKRTLAKELERVADERDRWNQRFESRGGYIADQAKEIDKLRKEKDRLKVLLGETERALDSAQERARAPLADITKDFKIHATAIVQKAGPEHGPNAVHVHIKDPGGTSMGYFAAEVPRPNALCLSVPVDLNLKPSLRREIARPA